MEGWLETVAAWRRHADAIGLALFPFVVALAIWIGYRRTRKPK